MLNTWINEEWIMKVSILRLTWSERKSFGFQRRKIFHAILFVLEDLLKFQGIISCFYNNWFLEKKRKKVIIEHVIEQGFSKWSIQTRDPCCGPFTCWVWRSTITTADGTQSSSIIGWGCRIHWLHLSRRVRTPAPTSVLDMTLNNLTVRLK